MTIKHSVPIAALALALAGCAQPPAKPSDTHLGVEVPPPTVPGTIPPPVQVAPALPKPQPAARPETYSVVVNNVRVQDLLFALARDARVNVDIHPGIAGSVTLNAIDQTLPQLLERIANQVDMRYELNGPNLLVMRDSPFLRTYRVDFVSASRNVKMQSQTSTQFSAGGAAGASSGQGTGSTATIDVASNTQLWDTLVQNVKDILQETDKVLPGGTQAAPAPAAAAGGAQPAAAQPSASYREAASVIGNRESGVLFIRASSRQHDKIQEFLDSVLANVRRQVLVEATVAEVQLNNEYQRGIDWQRLRTGASVTGTGGFGTGQSGVEFSQSSTGTPAAISTTAFVLGGALISQNLNVAIKLLESFGDVRVLSSPKVAVLNNQTALLRVTRDIVYFTITPSSTPVTVTGGAGGVVVPPSFTTTPNVAAEGFMMSVLPQVNTADTIVLNVRPTIRRRVADATDPNPALSAASPNLIPIFETREFDSMLRIQSGETAVLGGLMQDSVENIEDTIPGINRIPLLGWLFSQQRKVNRKTELVIFLRATVIRDASVEGDYGRFRGMLPTENFLRVPDRGAPPAQ